MATPPHTTTPHSFPARTTPATTTGTSWRQEQDAYLCIQTREESQDAKAANIRDTQRLLDKLQEEAAEVIQAVSKIRRFGPHAHHPDRTQTNLQELVVELEDFLALVAALEARQLFDLTPSRGNISNKFAALLEPHK